MKPSIAKDLTIVEYKSSDRYITKLMPIFLEYPTMFYLEDLPVI